MKGKIQYLRSSQSFWRTCNDLVRKEAILNCSSHKWSSFLCILGLSSVLGTNISIYYPDCGELQYKLLFNNRLIKPRRHNHNADLDAIHLLFCFDGRVEPGPGKNLSA